MGSSLKAPEEVVTDGYEGAAIYVQCGQRRPHSITFGSYLVSIYLIALVRSYVRVT